MALKDQANKIIIDARQQKDEREKGYREQALKLYPWICGRCAREFTHTNLRELTVHHKNHNHDDNPANGSNWELLCLYCHDNEHARYTEESLHGGKKPLKDNAKKEGDSFNPFANLKDLLKK
ncbi:MAG: HNH nuclease family protein [Methylococcaceae bacterium]|nr:HNH nuclease family protein [Methylococcaceae bacterium]